MLIVIVKIQITEMIKIVYITISDLINVEYFYKEKSMKRFYTKTAALILMLVFMTNLSAMGATVRIYNSVHPARYHQPARYAPAVNYVYTQPVNYSYTTPVVYYEPVPTYIQTQTVSYVPAPVYQAPVVQRTVVNEYHTVERGGLLGPLLGVAALSVGIVALCKR